MLVAAAVAVLGMGVYLYLQVKATPAQADATHLPTTPPKPSPNRIPTEVAEVEPKVAEVDKPLPGSTRTSWERSPRGQTGETPSEGSDDTKVDLKTDNLLELASKAYDAQDFDQATAIAGKVLAKDPKNVRMLRIMVSANCIQGDSVLAQQHYEKLPPFDREQMKTRCDRYGVLFKEPAQ